jgi:hypothetical protein
MWQIDPNSPDFEFFKKEKKQSGYVSTLVDSQIKRKEKKDSQIV